MVQGRKNTFLSVIGSKTWSSYLLIVLIFNVINSSVNFTERGKKLNDPIDTFSELVYEWCLDGDAETIPDDGAAQDDQSIKTLKIFWTNLVELIWIHESPVLFQKGFTKTPCLVFVFLPLGTPPPDTD